MRLEFKSLISDEEGSYVALTAFMMVDILGFAGMGIDIADYGNDVLAGVNAWWETARSNEDFTRPVETYYGTQPLHEIMERTTWPAAIICSASPRRSWS